MLLQTPLFSRWSLPLTTKSFPPVLFIDKYEENKLDLYDQKFPPVLFIDKFEENKLDRYDQKFSTKIKNMYIN
jgi:hypothetical protein